MFKKFIFLFIVTFFVVGGVFDTTSSGIPYIITITPPKLNALDFEQYIVQKNRKVNKILVPEIARSIVEDSRLRGLDPLTVLAVIGVESSYYKNAKGDDGEIGLMQISPRHWVYDVYNKENLIKIGMIKPISKKNPRPENELWIIQKNISGGTHVLAVKKKRCQIWNESGRLRKMGFTSVNECMIRRYNGGTSKKTRRYYQRVTANVGDYYYFAKANGLKVPNLVALR